MTTAIRSEPTRAVVVVDGNDRLYVNADGSIELASPAANPTGNKIPTAGQLPFTKEYVSPPFTDYAAGGTKVLTHALAVRPKNAQVWLRCTAAISGFAVGEEVLVGTQVSDSNVANQYRGVQLSLPSASDIRLVYGAQNAFILWNASGAILIPTAANFEAFVRAWA